MTVAQSHCVCGPCQVFCCSSLLMAASTPVYFTLLRVSSPTRLGPLFAAQIMWFGVLYGGIQVLMMHNK
jgi:hypothetical protein